MHFVIVSYTFPPSKEIGGRRWAKFSKELRNAGLQVSVICSKENDYKESDLKEYAGITINHLPKYYPVWLEGHAKTLFEKIAYKLCVSVLSKFIKNNIFDRGVAWKKPLIATLNKINKSKPIDVLIVSGAPFSLLYYASKFKLENKNVVYIADIRDPWTWGNLFGIPNMSAQKKQFQEYMELTAIKTCDMFVYPTKNMGDFLLQKYKDYTDKFYLLPHAYEPDKFKNIVKTNPKKGFIYGGTLYSAIDDYIKDLEVIVNQNLDTTFNWEIYTSTEYPLISSGFANGRIKVYGLIPETELFQKIANAKAYLAFFPPSDKDLISTKFFEIVYIGTPIIYVGEEGEVARFIRENKLGVHILPKNLMDELPKYIDGEIPVENNSFDVTKYSFTNVTKEFLKILQHKFN